MKRPHLSVIVPAYNEETNIRLGALDRVVHYLSRQSYTWEALLVNDGSSDDTKKLLALFVKENPGFRLVDCPHRGKAATVISGMKEAVGDVVLFTDLDQATPLAESEKLLPFLGQGYDIVIGSRKEKREGAPFLRMMMARGFMMLRSVLLGLNGIEDTQCGFKAFRRQVVESLVSKLKLYETSGSADGAMVTAGFDVELLYVAKRLGYTIKEVPVEWHYVDTRRVNPIRDSWLGLLDILKIKLNSWQGKYGTS